MALKTCGTAKCCPVEQVRSEMAPGDYHDVIAANPPGAERWGGVPDSAKYGIPQGSPEAEAANQAHVVEADPANASDVRICCRTCGKATGWNKADAPGMPGVGLMFTRNLWNGV